MPPTIDSLHILIHPSPYLLQLACLPSPLFSISNFFLMIPTELEKPRVTEIRVRMDCNGCVKKIRKALRGITGIYDVYIDFPEKLTVVGWADPEKIVEALGKKRKTATISSHTEPSEQPSQPADQPPNGSAPPAEAANPPPTEAPPVEPPKDPLPPENPPPPAENSQPEADPPPPESAAKEAQQPPQDNHPPLHTSMPKDVGEVHLVYRQPPDDAHRCDHNHSSPCGHYYKYPSGHRYQYEPPLPPSYVTHHNYSTYRPSPYVTEYEHVRSPPPQYNYSQYRRVDHYAEEDYCYTNNANTGNANITSIFSDENPNACRVM